MIIKSQLKVTQMSTMLGKKSALVDHFTGQLKRVCIIYYSDMYSEIVAAYPHSCSILKVTSARDEQTNGSGGEE